MNLDKKQGLAVLVAAFFKTSGLGKESVLFRRNIGYATEMDFRFQLKQFKTDHIVIDCIEIEQKNENGNGVRLIYKGLLNGYRILVDSFNIDTLVFVQS